MQWWLDTWDRREGRRGLGRRSLRLPCGIEKTLAGPAGVGAPKKRLAVREAPTGRGRPSSGTPPPPPRAVIVWEQLGQQLEAVGQIHSSQEGIFKGAAPRPPQTLTK